MKLLSRVTENIRQMDELASADGLLQRQSAGLKLAAVLLYIAAVMLRSRYDIFVVLWLAVIPLAVCLLCHLPLSLLAGRLLVAFPALFFLGAAEPFVDRTPAAAAGVCLTGGTTAMLVLWLKGSAAVTAAFVLTATTPMEKIAKVLRSIGVPRLLTTSLLLSYRYIVLLLTEAEKLSLAYELRGSTRRISPREWGSLAGQLLLRTIDRAEQIGDSMELRGYR